MNATIDIKAPSGQSLEGFPQIATKRLDVFSFRNGYSYVAYVDNKQSKVDLHKGDKIIIEIGE